MSDHDKVGAAMDVQVDLLGRLVTLRQYLHALLIELWNEGEGFCGKRPFGDSGWENDIYLALVKAGLAEGSEDQWGEIATLDETAAHELVRDVIDALFGEG